MLSDPDFSLGFQTLTSTCSPHIFMPICDRHLSLLPDRSFSSPRTCSWSQSSLQEPSSLTCPSTRQRSTSPVYLPAAIVPGRQHCVNRIQPPCLPVPPWSPPRRHQSHPGETAACSGHSALNPAEVSFTAPENPNSFGSPARRPPSVPALSPLLAPSPGWEGFCQDPDPLPPLSVPLRFHLSSRVSSLLSFRSFLKIHLL